jgi:hypothetical protein
MRAAGAQVGSRAGARAGGGGSRRRRVTVALRAGTHSIRMAAARSIRIWDLLGAPRRIRNGTKWAHPWRRHLHRLDRPGGSPLPRFGAACAEGDQISGYRAGSAAQCRIGSSLRTRASRWRRARCAAVRLHGVCCTLHVSCMLHVACCVLSAAYCMSHVARCTLPSARCPSHTVPCRTLRGPVCRDYPRAPSPATAPPSLRNAPRCVLHRCILVRCTARVARCTARLCVACRGP